MKNVVEVKEDIEDKILEIDIDQEKEEMNTVDMNTVEIIEVQKLKVIQIFLSVD